MKKLLLLITFTILSFQLFSQETKCECYSQSGVTEKTGIGGWTSIIGYNSEGEQLQYHFYAAYFPPQELCIPRDNFWWQEVDAAILKAIKSHPIYKSSQIALKTDDPDATPTANSIAGGAFITQKKVYEIERLPGTIVSVDAYIKERFASKLNLCSDIQNESNSTNKEVGNTTKNSSSANNPTNSNYSSPNQISQEQATTNAINSFGNIIGNIAQNANESAERNARIEAQKITERNAIIADRRQELKDGKGSYNSQNKKTGEWTFYYPQTTAPMSNGSYLNGEKQGMWFFYIDETYQGNFTKNIKEAKLYKDGKVTETYTAERKTEYFTDLNDKKHLTRSALLLTSSKGGVSYAGKWIQNNKAGVRISEGFYNRLGYKEGKWIYGNEFKEKIWWGPVKKFSLFQESYYENGLEQGEQKQYFRNVNLSSISFYKDGKKDGLQKEFYENGQLSQESYYNNDIIKGSPKKYNTEGNEIVARPTKDEESKILEDYFKEMHEYISTGSDLMWRQEDNILYQKFEPNQTEYVTCTEKVIDADGNSRVCDLVQAYGDDGRIFILDGKKGIIQKKGKTLIKPEWNHLYYYSFHNGLLGKSSVYYVAEKSRKFFLLDNKGRNILPNSYDALEQWKTHKKKKNRLIVVMNNWKFGLINEKGEEVLPLEYEFIGQLSSGDEKFGMARIKKDGKWGFLNMDAEIVIPIIYDSVLPFKDDPYNWSYNEFAKAEVVLNGEKFFVDINGNRSEKE